VETEQGVTQELEAARQGVTSLIIAHRLSTVRRADSIVVVAAGRVVERGTHAQLMQAGGVYHNLVSTAERSGQGSFDMPADAEASVGSMDGGDSQPEHELAGML
jgi:ABC-type transport system involved in cytochrome bd biosynthesis fused ATPase/permease subunit